MEVFLYPFPLLLLLLLLLSIFVSCGTRRALEEFRGGEMGRETGLNVGSLYMKSLSLSSSPMRSMIMLEPLFLTGTMLSLFTGAGADKGMGALLTLLKAVKAEEFWLLRTLLSAAIS